MKMSVWIAMGEVPTTILSRLMDKAIAKFCNTHDVAMLGDMLPDERRKYVVERILLDYIGEKSLKE